MMRQRKEVLGFYRLKLWEGFGNDSQQHFFVRVYFNATVHLLHGHTFLQDRGFMAVLTLRTFCF
jgi:hypothetical protein